VELCSKMDHVSYNYNSVLQGLVCYYNKHHPLVSAYNNDLYRIIVGEESSQDFLLIV